MPDPQPRLPPTPRRRREDGEVDQLRELVRTEAEVVATLARRMGVVEREVSVSRQLREQLRLDEMGMTQKRAIFDVTEWWTSRDQRDRDRRTRLERMVQASAIAQAITAVVLLALTVWTFFHHP